MQQIKLKNEIIEFAKASKASTDSQKKKTERNRLREKNALKYTGLLFDL